MLKNISKSFSTVHNPFLFAHTMSKRKKGFCFMTINHSYWLSTINTSNYDSLNEDIHVDIGIVGGGITGITAAFLLSQSGFKVCVIDAKNLLHGTTGYTTAKITAQHGLIYDELIQHYGEEFALKYYEANKRAAQFISDTIHTYNIDASLTVEDAYLFTNDSAYMTKLENEKRAYEKLNIDHDLLETVQTPFQAERALVMKNQAHFHPLVYLRTLIEQCEINGVMFFENTRAIHINYSNHPNILCDNDKRIICNYVIQASHYPFFDGAKFFPVKMYASRSYVILIKPKKRLEKGMYINAEMPTRSIRPIVIDGEPMLLISGENHKTGQSNVPMKEHYSNLITFAEETFGIDRLLLKWSAQDYTTLDKVPYIGKMTNDQHRVFVATGYNKWGMTNGTNAALLITDLILEKENPYEAIFSPSRSNFVDPAVKNFISYNVDVAKHLVKGKLQTNENRIDALQNNEACVIEKEGQKIGVYKDDDGKLHAVDTTCTHLGCEVNWNNAENSWDCPCHGSRFTYDGEILNGPAEKPLKKIDLRHVK